jgi:two-component system sensor histidine kinase YesM
MRIRIRFLLKSLRFKLIFGLLIIVIPLVVFMIYNNLYAIKVVHKQVTQSNKNFISLYMGQIDNNLEEVNKYLYNFAVQETELFVLELPRVQNLDQYNFAKIQLNNKLLKDLPNYKIMDTFFVYSSTNQDLLTVISDQVGLNKQDKIEKNVIKFFRNQSEKGASFEKRYIHDEKKL